jgi:hypothetical protein
MACGKCNNKNTNETPEQKKERLYKVAINSGLTENLALRYAGYTEEEIANRK